MLFYLSVNSGQTQMQLDQKFTWLTLIWSLDSHFIFLLKMIYLLFSFIRMTKQGYTKNETEALGKDI